MKSKPNVFETQRFALQVLSLAEIAKVSGAQASVPSGASAPGGASTPAAPPSKGWEFKAPVTPSPGSAPGWWQSGFGWK